MGAAVVEENKREYLKNKPHTFEKKKKNNRRIIIAINGQVAREMNITLERKREHHHTHKTSMSLKKDRIKNIKHFCELSKLNGIMTKKKLPS